MLADLAAPEKKFPPAREFDGLEDDVATISYEQALRAHTRFNPLPQSPNAVKAERPATQGNLFAGLSFAREDVKRKSASVTVRMSGTECEQLRRRAAEAGITVSAYLRSCAFEVETLRAQVKDAVAQMRSGSTRPAARRLWRWLRRG